MVKEARSKPDRFRRILALEAKGDVQDALALCNRAIANGDAPPRLFAKRGQLLRRCDRDIEALEDFNAALTQRSDHPAALEGRACLLFDHGRYEDALADYTALTAAVPDNTTAILGQITSLQRLGKFDAALEFIGAQTVSDARVAVKHSTLLRLIHQPEAALPVMQHALSVFGETPFLLCETGHVELALGLFAEADRTFKTVLERRPGHIPAHLGRIAVAQGQDDLFGALRHCETALSENTGHAWLSIRCAALLRQISRPVQALSVLQAALEAHPNHIGLLEEVAKACVAAGRYSVAEEVYARLAPLLLNPEPIALDRADNALAAGDRTRAAQLLCDQFEIGGDTSIALRALEIGLPLGDFAQKDGLLAELQSRICTLESLQTTRLAKIAVSQGDTSTLHACLERLGAVEHICFATAEFLMKRALRLPDEAVRTAVSQNLATKANPSERALISAECAMLNDGPAQALQMLRAEAPSPRSQPEARALQRYLGHLGAKRLQRRYLQACKHRWPHAPWLRAALLQAHHACGDSEAAEAFLAKERKAHPELDFARLEVAHQINMVDPFAAYARMRANHPPGHPIASLDNWFNLAVSAGELDDARALLPQMRNRLHVSSEQNAHFMSSQFGARYNELVLFEAERQAAKDTGIKSEDFWARAAGTYIFPAIKTVHDWVNSTPVQGAGAPIPRQIFQYWDMPEPPKAISALISTWSGQAGYGHRLFSRREAMIYLQEHFGSDMLRAFKLANHVSEESDFFRLCLLLNEGGIYVDADDLCHSSPDVLLNTFGGLVVFRENFGALANNLILAAKGHPIIARAVRMAAQSLLARENDNTWSKTGPGLLTRAVAASIISCQAEGTAADLTILPFHSLRKISAPHIQLPYKKTPEYWGNLDTHAEAFEAAFFDELVRRPQGD